MRRPRHLRFDNSDGDALKTLALSLILLAASGSVSYLLLLGRVLFQALATPCREAADVYLVFGKKLASEQPDMDYRARLDRLLTLMPRDTILLGGTTGKATRSEARAGFEYLSAQGYPDDLLHLEQDSNNTLENLKNARRILKERDAALTLIISSRYHLARCDAMARSLGIPHRLCAAESRFKPTLPNVSRLLAEAFYLHWFFSGKYWATLTGNRTMLDKIGP